jgi:hypothetical protein
LRCPALLSLWKSFRAQTERGSGIGLKLFGFIAESVFTFVPESCSVSPRNAVRNHPGIEFTFARIPQPELRIYVSNDYLAGVRLMRRCPRE